MLCRVFKLAVVPLYGVLTHCDKVDVSSEKFLEKEKGFMDQLGVPDNRYRRVQNYCQDYDKLHNTDRMTNRIPEIENPVIAFMIQVIYTYALYRSGIHKLFSVPSYAFILYWKKIVSPAKQSYI